MKMVNTLADKSDNQYNCVNSYVILDLETTGLPCLDFNRTKITEITLISVFREHILERFNENQKCKLNKDYIPRTINKLSECVYPRKRISEAASIITGLTNEILEPFHPFDETLFNILLGCLDRLKKPVCIIAHNGYRFDFPILQAEIQKLGKMFPDDIMCADSIQVFRNLLSPPKSKILKEIQPLNNKQEETKTENTSDWDSDEYDELLLSATIKAENCEGGTEKKYDDVSQLNKQQCGYGGLLRQINETTPKRTSMGTNIIHKPRQNQSASNITPPASSVKCKVGNSGENSKKRLFFDSPEVPKSYKLIDVYEFLTKKPLSNAHRAEADSVALLECMTAIGPKFIDWVDANNKPFNSVKKLW